MHVPSVGYIGCGSTSRAAGEVLIVCGTEYQLYLLFSIAIGTFHRNHRETDANLKRHNFNRGIDLHAC